MERRTIIIHDRSVYEALRRQAKINRRFALFSLIATIQIIFLYKKLEKPVSEDGGNEM